MVKSSGIVAVSSLQFRLIKLPINSYGWSKYPVITIFHYLQLAICIHYFLSKCSTLVDILHHVVAYMHLLHRSEIHENLKCSRCNKDGNSLLGGNGFDLAATEHKPSMPGVQDYIDIGGFGEISGCLQIMDSSHHQVSFVEILFAC